MGVKRDLPIVVSSALFLAAVVGMVQLVINVCLACGIINCMVLVFGEWVVVSFQSCVYAFVFLYCLSHFCWDRHGEFIMRSHIC